MAYVQNYLDPFERIQELSVFIEDHPALSDHDNPDEDSIVFTLM